MERTNWQSELELTNWTNERGGMELIGGRALRTGPDHLTELGAGGLALPAAGCSGMELSN